MALDNDPLAVNLLNPGFRIAHSHSARGLNAPAPDIHSHCPALLKHQPNPFGQVSALQVRARIHWPRAIQHQYRLRVSQRPLYLCQRHPHSNRAGSSEGDFPVISYLLLAVWIQENSQT